MFFPASRGGGNPLGVVLDAAHWSDADMQAFAAWTGLVETAYILPPSTAPASYRVRIFTPLREIAFAGHPSIGSAHAVLELGLAESQQGRLVQECGAGLLGIRVEGSGAQRELFVQSPAARVLVEPPAARPLLDAALGAVRRGRLAPMLVEGGRRWWVAEIASEAELRAWPASHADIAALARASDSMGLCVFARCSGGDCDVAVRAFPAGVGIVEDPASGAANGLIAAAIAAREPDGSLARGYRVSQGREIGHDARILIRIDPDSGVWVGGCTSTVISGTLAWPVATEPSRAG